MKVEAIEGLENRQNEGFRTITEKGKEWLLNRKNPTERKDADLKMYSTLKKENTFLSG